MAHSSSVDKTARKAKKSMLDTHTDTLDVEPVASTSTVPPELKKKKKSKSRSAAEDEPSHAPSDQTNSRETHLTSSEGSRGDTRRDRKSKDVAALVEDVDVNSLEATNAEEQPKKRKKGKKTTDVDGADGVEKKKSRKGKEVDQSNEEQETTVTAKKSKKEKKRKRGDQPDDEAVTVTDDGPPAEAPKKKKRKRGKTGFPNPEEDESLSEQARKALHYAFCQFDDPTSWKFNKAKQNWLIRNIWSQQAISDVYMPLLTKYLEGVQGGAREAILRTCKDVLTRDTNKPAENAPTEGETANTNLTPDTSSEATDETKHSRAADVLAVLSEN
ncbi:hypothetical protein C8Q72DRAFT_360273 [Fomitopsis betulina]|nr:hypothetical protein C8Q72DRAFT_360273 [Fomitopsis betulina]